MQFLETMLPGIKRFDISTDDGRKIDNIRKPAFEVLCEEVGEVLARQLEQTAGDIAVALSIQGSDQRDYLVRHLIGYDRENKLLAIAGQTTHKRKYFTTALISVACQRPYSFCAASRPA